MKKLIQHMPRALSKLLIIQQALELWGIDGLLEELTPSNGFWHVWRTPLCGPYTISVAVANTGLVECILDTPQMPRLGFPDSIWVCWSAEETKPFVVRSKPVRDKKLRKFIDSLRIPPTSIRHTVSEKRAQNIIMHMGVLLDEELRHQARHQRTASPLAAP